MINSVLTYLRSELLAHLGLDESQIILADASTLTTSTAIGCYVTVVNLEEEAALKNLSHSTRVAGQVVYREPPIHLNLSLLITCRFDQYVTSLVHLSSVIEFFQHHRVFSAEHQRPANPFPAVLEKLLVEFQSQNFEKLNHMWGMLGGLYLPSALYKLRMIKVQLDEDSEGPEIRSIRVDSTVS